MGSEETPRGPREQIGVHCETHGFATVDFCLCPDEQVVPVYTSDKRALEAAETPACVDLSPLELVAPDCEVAVIAGARLVTVGTSTEDGETLVRLAVEALDAERVVEASLTPLEAIKVAHRLLAASLEQP